MRGREQYEVKVRKRLWVRGEKSEIYSDGAKWGKKQCLVPGMCIRPGRNGSVFPRDADPSATMVRSAESLLEEELTTLIRLEGGFSRGEEYIFF